MTDPLIQDADTGEALTEAVARFIDRHALIEPRGAVVVGISGGADSVALLAVLRELARRPQRAYRLTAAHMDHGLRPAAEADAAFVAELAGAWHIPCKIERREVAGPDRHQGQGIEEVARSLRYAFFRRVAEDAGAACVAVGHHADDNVETVLSHLLRGTHLRGLAGMRARRPLGDSHVMLVRPLLRCRRTRIEQFCRGAGLSWRTDPSNEDKRFRRNFIRHELLPLIRTHVNPRADEAIDRMARAAGEADETLNQLGREALAEALVESDGLAMVLDAPALASQPPALQAYALRSALERMRMPMKAFTAEHVAALCGLLQSGGPAGVSLPGKWSARREQDLIVLSGPSKGPAAPLGPRRLCPEGATTLDDGRQIICRIGPLDRGEFEAHCRGHREGVEMLDADRLCGPLVCRCRRDGDAFWPLGSPGRQTVGDFLTNLKLTGRRRDQVVCICDESGIVYVAPLRIDRRVMVTGETTRVLRIELSGPP